MLQLLCVTWAEDKIVPTWKIARAEWRGLMILIEYFSIQELTEEGLPFLILFHMKEDTESLEIFQNEVARQLISEKGRQIKVFISFFSLFFNFPSFPLH